jgi:FixJ family two-component response regulator
MLLCTEKMDVESPADLGSVPAAVCIVDDDPSMLKALGRLLASVGLPGRLFREPLGFLKYATRNPVTVALIDI